MDKQQSMKQNSEVSKDLRCHEAKNHLFLQDSANAEFVIQCELCKYLSLFEPKSILNDRPCNHSCQTVKP